MFGFSFSRTKAQPIEAPTPLHQRPTRAYRAVRSAVRSMFAGAGTNRTDSTAPSNPLTADQVVMKEQRILVARSRHQAANSDYAKAFLRLCRQNIVGPQGITLVGQVMTGKGTLDIATNEALEWAWSEWSKAENCDVKGRQSLRDIELACVNGAATDGEFMVRLVWGEAGGDAGPWGFCLQTMDPVRCPVDLNVERPQGGGFIRHGIHFNQYGRPLGYYFTTTNEADEAFFYGGKAYHRIPAEEMLHGFREDMVGQKRGFPWMSTGLNRMRHLTGLEDAAVIAARIGASQMGFVQWKEGFGPRLEDGEEVPEYEAEAGTFQTLPEGAELKEWKPNYPSGEFAPFAKHLLRGAAAGFGVPYNELAADLEGVNFSSIRQGTLDSRENWKDLQQWLMEQLMSRVYAQWLPRALLSGRIKVRGKPLAATTVERLRAIAWQGRRWQWIDPRADVDAAVESKNNMLASPGEIIREQGKDPLAVWKATARDLRSMVDTLVNEGFPDDKAMELVMLSMGKQPEKPQPKPAEKKEPANA